jgi:protein-tyrosine kinase
MSTPEILRANAGRKAVEATGSANTSHLGMGEWGPVPVLDEQIYRMVRQIFFAPSSKSPKQIVFSAIEEGTDVAGICMQAAEALSLMVAASVAVVEASAFAPDARDICQSGGNDGHEQTRRQLEGLRHASAQLSLNLWSVPGTVLWGGNTLPGSPRWIQGRLAELRLNFEFALIHASPIGQFSETALLSQSSDGVVLVLEANITRRAAALKVKEMLRMAKVRILGSVLSGRTYPVPESIYRRI